ncbi:MAG: serine/threonine protein kinase [Labilithrix sp.]|nr:serine/threonine protein kinase [Labilithrix sp.]
MSAKGPELKAGEMIPGTKYRVVRSLGAGGMGVVFQVVKPPNIQGVLKLMSTDLSAHEEHRMRFFDEVRILAQLEHPNIVRVFDYDALPDGTPFYVMELLSGRTVRDAIYTMGRVPPRVAYEITRQLLEALQAAHTHEVPVIHRDIKPENIFLHAPRHGEPVVKLIDFGVSAVADRKHDGAFVGTWSYAAPEQIRGHKPTPATDLYAAGLVLYEMLAGVGPFDHYDDWARVSKAQLEEIPAPVSKFAPWVPASIVTLIQSALAKDPRTRPRDAYAFAERLFELEWASDGQNAHDLTAEGPSPMHRPPARSPAVGGPIEIGGSGPLSRVLSSITSTGHASSKKMAAASPAADRLGDVPLIGVPPESLQKGPTWRGVGGRDHTSPDANALLAGLDAPGGKPPSKRERSSNPELDMLPPAPRTPPPRPVVAAAVVGPGTAVTLDEVPAGASPGARDTISSQSSDARRALPRSRTGLLFLAGALLVGGFVAATVVVLRGNGNAGARTTTALPASEPTAAVAPSMASTPTPSTVDAPSASASVSPPPAPTAPAKSGHKGVPPAKPPIATSGAAATAHATSPAPQPAPHAPTTATPPTPTASNGGEFIRHF